MTRFSAVMLFGVLSLPLLMLAMVPSVRADFPMHCEKPQVMGTWDFKLGPNTGANTLDCSTFNAAKDATSTLTVTFSEPNVVTNEITKETGTWTMIYDEGFEFTISGKVYFSWFAYEVHGANVTSHCADASPTTYHDVLKTPGVIPSNWGCYAGGMTPASRNNGVDHDTITPLSPPVTAEEAEKVWEEEHALVAHINSRQSDWVATSKSPFVGMKTKDVVRQMGTPFKVHHSRYPRAARDDRPDHVKYAGLPDSWDWSNVNGTSFLAPVRSQGQCGSCYAHSSTSMFDARIRILSNNARQDILAPQSVVSCNRYSQGCDGGFAYLVSKFAQDFGLATESCFPYVSGSGTVPACSAQCSDKSQLRYSSGYAFVGGFVRNVCERGWTGHGNAYD